MNIFKWFIELITSSTTTSATSTPIVTTTSDASTTIYPWEEVNFRPWICETYASVKRSKKSPKNYTVYRKTKGYILSRHPDLQQKDTKLIKLGNLQEFYKSLNCNGQEKSN